MQGEFHLPEGTQIGHVHLRVADLARSLAFYADLLGFGRVGREEGAEILSATGAAPYHLLLTESPGASPRPRGTPGLYHLAIRVPSRLALGRVLLRLMEQRWPLHGVADHGVSEALYLADPDGNGLEIYTDRPREAWPRQGHSVAMATDPLDTEALLRLAEENPPPGTGIDPGTDIGHVHLQVADLARAEAFYHGLLGLDVTQRDYAGALFFAAGGYHHHVATNVWGVRGDTPAPPEALGLIAFSLHLPDLDAWRALRERLLAAGLPVAGAPLTEWAHSFLTRDPDGSGVQVEAR